MMPKKRPSETDIDIQIPTDVVLESTPHPSSPQEKVYITLISGSIAATVATYAKQPLARVKYLKQVSESLTKIEQTNIFNIYVSIIKNEGFFTGLFRGSHAAITRNIPHSAITYSLYPIYHNKLITNSNSNMLSKSLSGSLASMTAHIITHPLDTVRVRIAVQYGTIEYGSISNTISTMFQYEGINGFYRGLQVTLLGAIFRAGVGFGLYESFKSTEMREWTPSSSPLIGRLFIGFMSGTSATLLSYPFDTVRRRQQVFGKNRNIFTSSHSHLIQNIGGNIQKHVSATNAVKWIYATEGIRGFYKGILLALLKSPLASSISLTTNDVVKSYFGWKS